MLKYKGLVSFCENVGTDESCYQKRMQPPPAAASKQTFHSENLLWPAAADTRDTSPLRLFRHCNCSSSFVTVVVFFSCSSAMAISPNYERSVYCVDCGPRTPARNMITFGALNFPIFYRRLVLHP